MSDRLKAIVVEDEKNSREMLISYVEKYCPGVEVIGEGHDVPSGVEAIRKGEPNLVFLDVEMPFGNAFDLLEQLGDMEFETIFVTAYSHYAIKALNHSASYYLLKPVDIDELIEAVEKVRKRISEGEAGMNTKILIDNMKLSNDRLKKVVLPVMDGFEVVEVGEIIRCEANDNFTDFYLRDGSRKVICRTLKFYEDVLEEFNFMRVHRSHLVNLDYVKGYKKGKGGQVVMTDDSVVDVSVGKKKAFLSRFGEKGQRS